LNRQNGLRDVGRPRLRRIPPDGHLRAALGAKGRPLLLIEDVVTTGGQMVLSVQDLRAEGAIVEHALCVIDREGGGADVVGAEGIELRALFTMRDLEQYTA